MSSAQARNRGERTIEDGLLTIRTGPLVEPCVLTLSGELDLSNVDSLHGELRRVAAARLQTLVLDLSRLRFVDSLGVSCLLKAARLYRERPRLRVLRGSTEVERVLRLTGVGELLPYAD
jgi:anti-sigma B factor antagonist